MGLFSGTNKAPAPNGGGLRFAQGEFEVEINVCKEIDARNKGKAFVVEFTILERLSPEPKPYVNKAGVVEPRAHQPGERPGWFVPKYGKAAEMFEINSKAFLTAVCGLNSYNDKDTAAIAAIGEEWDAIGESATQENAFAGFRVHVEVIQTLKRDGEPFDKFKFTPSTNPTAAQQDLLK